MMIEITAFAAVDDERSADRAYEADRGADGTGEGHRANYPLHHVMRHRENTPRSQDNPVDQISTEPGNRA